MQPTEQERPVQHCPFCGSDRLKWVRGVSRCMASRCMASRCRAAARLTPQKLMLLRLLSDSAEPPTLHEMAAHLRTARFFVLDTLAECLELGLLVFGEEGRPVLTPLGRATARNPGEGKAA